MLSEIITKSKQYIKNVQQKPAKRHSILKQLIQSPDFESWICLDSVIRFNVQQKDDLELMTTIKDTIGQVYNNLKSFAMMMFLYSLQVQGRIPIQYISWPKLYKQFCVNDNELLIFNSWAFNPESYRQKHDIIQNTLQMISKYYTIFLKSNSIAFTDLQFDSIVQWILRMKTQTPEKFQIANNLSKIIRHINIAKHQNDYISKQHLVIKKIFENIGEPICESGNAFLLLQPEKNYSERQVNYFCNIYDQYLNSLNQDYLVNAFRNLVLGGITQPILLIVEKVSAVLSSNEEYFKLRCIYQNFVLTHLTKYKACLNLTEKVFNIVEFYVLGFLRHCNIGMNGVQYLVEDIQSIKNKQIQLKWLKMVQLVGLTNQLLDQVLIKLKQKGFGADGEQISQRSIDITKVWDVTLRTGKKHKRYTKVICSDYKGIQNQANECYVISVVQGLFFTRELKGLLDSHRTQIKNKLLLLDQLRVLFSQLSGKTKATNIVISYLKARGPQEFRLSKHQQDSMHYLIQLLDKIKGECSKVPGMVYKFDLIFKINCQHTTKCQNCKQQTTNVEDEYIHTIPHTKLLHLKVQQQAIQGYKCQKCKKTGQCNSTRTISPQCKVFIVHINRFSVKSDGTCKKQLSNQTILRRFLDYELVGMICHIGKDINSGHYVYFTKTGPKTWVQMNDKVAYRFQIDQAEQQFQRQMKADMSPYVLFYIKSE